MEQTLFRRPLFVSFVRCLFSCLLFFLPFFGNYGLWCIKPVASVGKERQRSSHQPMLTCRRHFCLLLQFFLIFFALFCPNEFLANLERAGPHPVEQTARFSLVLKKQNMEIINCDTLSIFIVFIIVNICDFSFFFVCTDPLS